jgi:T-complex protein 1 subunit theta
MGLTNMLKHGAEHHTGVQDAIIRNLEACDQLTKITRTSLGPNGMNKLIINHLEKLIVTADSATILKEMEVQHPAAKMLVLAAHMQEQEVGDGTNLVVTFGGEALHCAEDLLRKGLKPAEIVSGYALAQKKVKEILDNMPCEKVKDMRDISEVTKVLEIVLGSKNVLKSLAGIVAEACIMCCPDNTKGFNVGNVRVAKALGAGMSGTHLVKGLVMVGQVHGSITRVENAKVAVFSVGLDIEATDSKGTVLIKDADHLKTYNKTEEESMEAIVKEIADAGVTVAVFGSGISEIALHFLERYKIMVCKVTSKFELRRLCQATGATAMVRVGKPTAEEMGAVDICEEKELGQTRIVVFKNEGADKNPVSTIVLRASSQNILEDQERAINDGVNVYRALCRDNRLVVGGGACEIQLSAKLQEYADTLPGLEQYAVRAYGEAFEVIPRSLASNAGHKATELIADLYAAHSRGEVNSGVSVNVEGDVPIMDMAAAGVYDCLSAKQTALQLVSHTCMDVLRVDQIIMARPAGGPKMKGPNKNWDKDPVFG